MRLPFYTRAVRRAASTRLLSTSTTPSSLAAAVASSAATRPSSIALLAPQQGISWTFAELDEKARCLASGLEDLGYKPGAVAISDAFV